MFKNHLNCIPPTSSNLIYYKYRSSVISQSMRDKRLKFLLGEDKSIESQETPPKQHRAANPLPVSSSSLSTRFPIKSACDATEGNAHCINKLEDANTANSRASHELSNSAAIVANALDISFRQVDSSKAHSFTNLRKTSPTHKKLISKNNGSITTPFSCSSNQRNVAKNVPNLARSASKSHRTDT